MIMNSKVWDLVPDDQVTLAALLSGLADDAVRLERMARLFARRIDLGRLPPKICVTAFAQLARRLGKKRRLAAGEVEQIKLTGVVPNMRHILHVARAADALGEDEE